MLKGPNVMKGYKKNPEANKNAFTEDGWLRTGDLGSINEEGRLTIADRLKELIKVPGDPSTDFYNAQGRQHSHIGAPGQLDN